MSRFCSSHIKSSEDGAGLQYSLLPSTAIAMETPPSDYRHTNGDFVNDTSTIVIGLQPPPPASAYERALWRARGITTSEIDPSEPGSRGLHVVTKRVPTAVTDSGDDSTDTVSSGHSSPDLSTQGLRTPIDSPDISSLSLKDEAADMCLFVPRERASHTNANRSGPSMQSLEPSDAIIEAKFAPRSPYRKPTQTQGYTASINILEDEHNMDSDKTYVLLVDTACEDTFVMGKGVMQVLSGGRRDNQGLGMLVERTNWDLIDIIRGNVHTAIRNPVDPTLTNKEMEDRGNIIGEITFQDGGVAQLALVRSPRTCILFCYDWKREAQSTVYLYWQFGAAFAVNQRVMRDPTSGILGLGPHGTQRAYESRSSTPAPPTFLEVLEQRLSRIRTTANRRGETIAIYFALRLSPDSETYRNHVPRIEYPIQSWISFNGWPCTNEPQWNEKKIPICNPVPPDVKQWKVYLKRIKTFIVSPGVARPDLAAETGWEGTTMNFVNAQRPSGLRILLDTGSSLSYLPSPYVEDLYVNVYKRTLPDDVRTTRVTPPLPDWVERRKVQVLYEFEGKRGQSVEVYGPFERFFYQESPTRSGSNRLLEGLILPQDPDVDFGVFGLNFFQSMYVSLHKAKDGEHFVRMAPQWPENLETDLRDYEVEGLSAD
ncbi:uncharacterized protein C8Q71DRAFT_290245 [Rhodofomes roseus]|uniref:Aspartyl protease n=1 Tax=Rhodofomes roseus TaxID=34475 RepID=A0ABQ8K3X3_9APHY|nr:uncharacterized protein C8Q71DRAFT_290245 [Rhodofomes roseus]KAH9831539.1 hypothetical protein C8Q71DRAFT_290245 [Rhodofomes roseus]